MTCPKCSVALGLHSKIIYLLVGVLQPLLFCSSMQLIAELALHKVAKYGDGSGEVMFSFLGEAVC